MRRTFLIARPSRAVSRAFGNQQPRRAFATPPTKDNSPPSPIERGQQQAHPVGPFYEAVLRTPHPLPKEKPEEPPVTSQKSPAQTAQPASPEKQPPTSKLAAEEKAAEPAADEDKAAAKPTARRPRKTANSKAKSVSSSSPTASSSSSSSSSSFPNHSSPTAPGPALPPQAPPPQRDSTDPPSPGEQEAEQGQEAPSNDTQARARVVFGTRLAGPRERAERLAALRDRSRLVAGVLVPPRPEEPDNCCMSGCVNCVWDRYRDETEAWADATAEAERRLAAREVGEGTVAVTEESMDECGRGEMDLGVHDETADRWVASVDEDGGGSVGNWEGAATATDKARDGAGGRLVHDFWDDELYKNVPVGIREFMKHEKRLKEKHLREGTAGG